VTAGGDSRDQEIADLANRLAVAEESLRAVQAGDVGRLTAIPGIGKKTAERIGLELKDKLTKGIIDEASAGAAPGAPGSELRQDLLSALLNLGYHRPLAEKAVDAALSRADSPAFETVLKQALRELARG